jgi:hypothetical protein
VRVVGEGTAAISSVERTGTEPLGCPWQTSRTNHEGPDLPGEPETVGPRECDAVQSVSDISSMAEWQNLSSKRTMAP